MDYYKLLEDYLNRDYSDKEYEVLNWEDRGDRIEIHYSRVGNEWSDNKDISLFDLLTFVYSKII